MSAQETWTGHDFCVTGHKDGSIKIWKTVFDTTSSNTGTRAMSPTSSLGSVNGPAEGVTGVPRETYTQRQPRKADLSLVMQLNIHVSPVSCLRFNSLESVFYSGDDSGVVMSTSWREVPEGSGGRGDAVDLVGGML